MTTSVSPQSPASSPRPWQPSGDDHLIYRWVKFEGYTQSQVAQMLRISQPTVCRVIQRYERWQAHLKDREGGRLDAQERLRAQRWLTYERNELILASCLRIAEEMERSTELSKTTIRRPIDQPLKQNELRTEQRVVDRHGVASRFLRLAFRVNMEQLKLTELIAREGDPSSGHTPCAVPEPLSADELAAELHQAALDAAEIATARGSADSAVGNALCGVPDPPNDIDSDSDSLPDDVGCVESPSGDETHHSSSAASPQPPVPAAQPPAPPLHNLHTETGSKIVATSSKPCTCVLQISVDKNSIDTCIIDCDEVIRSEPDRTESRVDADTNDLVRTI